MTYSEYLKWSYGLSVTLTNADIDLLILSLSQLKSVDDDMFDIDVTRKKFQDLKNSHFEDFLINPFFTQK